LGGNTLCLVKRISVSLDQFFKDHSDVVRSDREHVPFKSEVVTEDFSIANPINGKVGSVNQDEHFLVELISLSNVEDPATPNVSG
jgi:hypothetical protein